MRQLYRALLMTLAVTSIMIVVMSGQTWATVAIQDADLPALTYKFSGRQIEPIISGLSVLPVAGILGLIAAKGIFQRIVGAIVALTGLSIGYLAIAVQAKKSGYVDSLLANKLGRDGVAHLTSFNPVSQVLVGPAIGILIVGLFFTLRNFDAAKKPGNYERIELGGVATLTPWQALDAGQDPTSGLSNITGLGSGSGSGSGT